MCEKVTELAALQLVNYINTEMDNHNVPTNFYLDLSKAFDTLNFDILLNKLDHYGIQGCSNRLLRSYLINNNNNIYLKI